MYDFLIGLAESIVKHGLSWSTAAAVLFLILKQRRLRRKLKKYIPHLFADDEPNTHYINNQLAIMENQRLMMERMGIECIPVNQTIPIPTNSKRLSKLYWGKIRMKNKFKSRKFWVAILGALIVIANETFDLGLSSESQATLVVILVSFILGESAVDAKRAGKETPNDTVDFTQDTSN